MYFYFYYYKLSIKFLSPMATINNNAAKAAQSNNGNNNLKFISTMTIEEFKSTFGADKLRCFNANESHHAFFAWSGSPFTYKNGDGEEIEMFHWSNLQLQGNSKSENPVVSEVEKPDGSRMMLLHEESRPSCDVEL
jgi:hypothetical protein